MQHLRAKVSNFSTSICAQQLELEKCRQLSLTSQLCTWHTGSSFQQGNFTTNLLLLPIMAGYNIPGNVIHSFGNGRREIMHRHRQSSRSELCGNGRHGTRVTQNFYIIMCTKLIINFTWPKGGLYLW